MPVIECSINPEWLAHISQTDRLGIGQKLCSLLASILGEEEKNIGVKWVPQLDSLNMEDLEIVIHIPSKGDSSESAIAVQRVKEQFGEYIETCELLPEKLEVGIWPQIIGISGYVNVQVRRVSLGDQVRTT